ncbi:hypothetical protein BLA29_000713 [Euroglyphus maynei]|uniref:Uncharacterized protein n=1 Tax=Euroglyphus maynei TaxID=6958 RepID=A0A1Y3AR49_EURMA|nr:hypothetical protein BLA29_000713 [Euroglyphus maynei]
MARKDTSTHNSYKLSDSSFDRIESTNVLIIGNGPSAITLSFLLAGHWPCYSPEDFPSPNENVTNATLQNIHDRLLYHCAMDSCNHDEYGNQHESISKPKLRSLMESDLREIGENLVGRTGANPISVLMDQLQHPNADFGERNPSMLKWTYRPDRRVDHIVIGSSESPGGIWHAIAKTCSSKLCSNSTTEMLTLSRRSLMQLPVLPIYDDENHQNDSDGELPSDNRVPYRVVANYYRRYVNHFGLDEFFHNHTRATLLDWDPIDQCFIVDASCRKSSSSNQRKYRVRYRAKRVVLAKGTSTMPRMLNIQGETFPFVLHSLTKLDVIIRQTQLLPCWRLPILSTSRTQSPDPILIVGSGLSAADALILLSQRCQRRPLRIIHLFRKSIRDRSLIFNQIATNDSNYPEYYQVFQKMKHSVQNNIHCLECLPHHHSPPSSTSSSKQLSLRFEYYQAYQECILSSIQTTANGHRTATLEFLNKNKSDSTLCCHCNRPINHQLTVRITFALILIGSSPQLDFVNENIRQRMARDSTAPIDHRLNPISIDPYTHECKDVPGLYALGPLVGDNFVRYVQGGALAAANHIYHDERNQNSNYGSIIIDSSNHSSLFDIDDS